MLLVKVQNQFSKLCSLFYNVKNHIKEKSLEKLDVSFGLETNLHSFPVATEIVKPFLLLDTEIDVAFSLRT